MPLTTWTTDENASLIALEGNAGYPLLGKALWIDLVSPTDDEKQLVSLAHHVELPTQNDMEEIETSSRLYREAHALFMITTLVAKADTDNPQMTSVAFIISGGTLITLRHLELQSFSSYIHYLERHRNDTHRSATLLAGLLEALVDRFSDILEITSKRGESINKALFAADANTQTAKDALINIGAVHNVTAKVRESLVSFGRLITFASEELPTAMSSDIAGRLAIFNRDIQSLSDQASFISNNLTFLLDATLGLINIEQNAIIKIFSVATMIFLPPTLIGTIYGMNFDKMPELHWDYGYPLAVVLMLISAYVPFQWFKRKGWL
ncbi:MAG: magnesium/cobalt transporter CorA [Alphaproteobacteria bacterium]|nr:magnesium/cobalt transporter CorA [Alphaproteobacteria bacterium]